MVKKIPFHQIFTIIKKKNTSYICLQGGSPYEEFLLGACCSYIYQHPGSFYHNKNSIASI
ncbi:hypothetical protein LRR81_10610 [Metabacillus sp. GX 13764]|uniref:hypothetical protein n=1 Tax=Metabacillus kandeliae TaxID=2900151 RepID=UPI001E52FAD3|nr:hypothetical protein [Metabacillus kandeliae]MCD7034693.1 hypothetical protein [Metabacillus kandeliae]